MRAAQLSTTEPGEKLGALLERAVDNASILTVATYVSDDPEKVQVTDGLLTGANLRALTRISLDGDILSGVPRADGQLDQPLWALHMEMVQRAQANRTEMLKAVGTTAAGLLQVLKSL